MPNRPEVSLIVGDGQRHGQRRVRRDAVRRRSLHGIVATSADQRSHSGAMDAAAAHAYVNELIKTHRYVRDVY